MQQMEERRRKKKKKPTVSLRQTKDDLVKEMIAKELAGFEEVDGLF